MSDAKQLSNAALVTSFLTGIFTRNLLTKVAALFLAVLVWFTVRLDLSKEFPDDQVVVRVVVEEGLMRIGPVPVLTKVRFQGPTSQIDTLKKLERRTVTFNIRKSDLRGQSEATMQFGAELGNLKDIGHSYGEEIQIVEIQPSPVRIFVAAKESRPVRVDQPAVDGLPAEWEATIDILTPEVEVEGPKNELSALESIQPAPIQASRILRGKEGQEVVEFASRRLDPPGPLAAKDIRLVAGAEILARITFRRTKSPKALRVPFRVYFERPDWPFTLEPKRTQLLEPTEDGFILELTFEGAPSDLARLELAIEAGEVRAYVRAEKFGPYRDGDVEEGKVVTDYLDEVFVEMPEDLRGRVTFQSPPIQSIELQTKRR